MTKPTRNQYMNREISHAEFYRSVYQAAGISMARSPLLPKVREALANGDEHLNSIPLQMWDSMATNAQAAIARALREHGDFYSLGDGVCTLKQAAKDAANDSA
jgi:hypothetical protein